MKATHAIQQLRSLLEEFSPQTLAAARGISSEDIEALESKINRSFCVGHRVFLEHFGATPKCSMGPFLYNYDFNARAVERYYRVHHEEPQSAWEFWTYVGEDPSPWHLYATSPAVEDPAIGSPVLMRINRESMWNKVLFNAYVFLVGGSFEERGLSGSLWGGRGISLADAQRPFTDVHNLLTRIGFVPWIDMANFQCMMRRQNTIIWFGRAGTRPNTDRWEYSISGPNPQELREIREVLADNVGAT